MSIHLPLTAVTADCEGSPFESESLSPEAADRLAVKFKALSDPVRLRLLSAVLNRSNREACVCDVSAGIDLAQPTISHHLKVLRTAGLLDSERRGTWVYYRAVPGALSELAALFDANAPTR